ncbi:hypothetical protein ONS95_014106 [Cadophora gregata]|uniref:uncharacterized protein n=1 Tax=Cadophora gregata TaxID=51156 RepID=UPI0026DD0242|nr:uncharacterized protein ONS95_014106 [Cadophora gregata]KAK0113864.1 hypothetical protein ONS96_014712 [Cadophora gregata f. sp. sojae]KAK0114623.1 hypothetical protein ONS95_014106 [Cadophora gregata]
MSATQIGLCQNRSCNSITGTRPAHVSPAADAFETINKSIRGTVLCSGCQRKADEERERVRRAMEEAKRRAVAGENGSGARDELSDRLVPRIRSV